MSRPLLRVQLLDAGPSLDRVAKTLELGHRTLQRQLAKEGVSFRSLKDTSLSSGPEICSATATQSPKQLCSCLIHLPTISPGLSPKRLA